MSCAVLSQCMSMGYFLPSFSKSVCTKPGLMSVKVMLSLRRPLGACNAAYGGDVPATVQGHVPVGRANHAHKAHSVGLHGLKLDVLLQLHVLAAYASHMHVQVDAAQSCNELLELCRGLRRRDVDASRFNPVRCYVLECLQPGVTAGCNADVVSPLEQQAAYLKSQAR